MGNRIAGVLPGLESPMLLELLADVRGEATPLVAASLPG
jgi:hypothetical protein